MSHSAHISGFKPPDDEWQRMKAVFDACRNADIDVPSNVVKYFGYLDPDDAGVSVSQKEMEMICLSKYQTDDVEGFEINVKLIPKDIKIIRFYCSF